MTVGTFLGVDEATVDDLVLRDDYAEAVQQSYEKTLTLNTAELAAPTNVRAMDLVFQRNEWGDFGEIERASAALWLAGQWADAGSVNSATLERARKLFREINRYFRPQSQASPRRVERTSLRERLLSAVS